MPEGIEAKLDCLIGMMRSDREARVALEERVAKQQEELANKIAEETRARSSQVGELTRKFEELSAKVEGSLPAGPAWPRPSTGPVPRLPIPPLSARTASTVGATSARGPAEGRDRDPVVGWVRGYPWSASKKWLEGGCSGGRRCQDGRLQVRGARG